MKRIIRLIFYIPILPILIVYFICKPLHFVIEKVLDAIHEMLEQYGRAVRVKFPWVMIQKECEHYDPEPCKGHSSKTCSYFMIGRNIVCPNDLKHEGKTKQ